MLRQCSQEASEAKTRANNKHSSEGKAQIARADEHDTGTQKPRPAHGGLQHADGRRVSENAELRPKHWHIDADADSVGMLVRSIWRRDNLVDVIMRNEPILRWPMGAGFDIYQFGVFTGGGMKGWVDGMRRRNITFGHMWGFDSFEGLPDSDLQSHNKHRAKDSDWSAGGINAADQLAPVLGKAARSRTSVMSHIVREVGYGPERTTLVPGYFNVSLPPLGNQGVDGHPFQPAMLVDIDCDIYEGTMEAIGWMIRRGLIIPGTVIYYDDWQFAGEGEVKAHAELTAKFGITWDRVSTGLERHVSFKRDASGFSKADFLWQVKSISKSGEHGTPSVDSREWHGKPNIKKGQVLSETDYHLRMKELKAMHVCSHKDCLLKTSIESYRAARKAALAQRPPQNR